MEPLNTSPQNKESWVATYRHWTPGDDKALIGAFYDQMPTDEIAKTFAREPVHVMLRLVQLGVLSPDVIGMLWDDYFDHLQGQ